MNKKIPVLVVSACLMWFAYQARDILMYFILGLTAIYTDTGPKILNIGGGQTVILEMPRDIIPKPYAIALRTEVVGGRNMSFDEVLGKTDYPKKFSIKTFRVPLFSKERKLIEKTTFTEGDRIYSGTSWEASNANNMAFSNTIYTNRLPPGKYIFEVEDLTQRSPEHEGLIIHLEGTVFVTFR